MKYFLLIITFLITNKIFCQIVSNVVTHTENDQIVITYDLAITSVIRLEISIDGHFLKITNCTGDFGEIVNPGIKKKIIWNIDRAFYNSTIITRIIADTISPDYVFSKVDVESEYPGGISAWSRYLNRNLRYPQDAIDNEVQGTVIVQFIVDKEGNVSNVEAVSGANELKDEAVRIIMKSGKWIPAVQNGRQVKSYKKKLIVFRLESEG